MFSKILLIFLITFTSLGLFKEAEARSESRSDLQDIVIEQRNQKLCEGPLGVNCPRDGKILGDLSWSPFSDDPKPTAPPPEDIADVPAVVEGIEYNNDVPHPLES